MHWVVLLLAVFGRILHELIVSHGSKEMLDMGTSTGHSTLWLAGLPQTAGRVITVEIDKGSRRQCARKCPRVKGSENKR